MGRLNTIIEQRATLSWAAGFSGKRPILPEQPTLRQIRDMFIDDLKRYFALCGLSRSRNAPDEMVREAWDAVFKVRVILEKAIQESIHTAIRANAGAIEALFSSSFFGSSKKQGVSLRFPLTSCNPTAICGAACYAHDVLDAGPESVVRGAVNGVVATLYECGEASQRELIENRLHRHVVSAVRSAKKEVDLTEAKWRRPRIRFSHVGEIAAWPKFANKMAEMVREVSNQEVDCVVYTRHRRAAELDPGLFVVNFTIDKTSEDRRKWAPEHSRLVYSAFDGDLSPNAEVNFLEHHRWSHIAPRSGCGNICPATMPNVPERTCDAVRCDKCFRPTNSLVQLGRMSAELFT